MGADNQETPSMIKICAWCNKDLETKEVLKSDIIRELCDQNKASHGICEPCRDDLVDDFGVSMQEMDTVMEIVSS